MLSFRKQDVTIRSQQDQEHMIQDGMRGFPTYALQEIIFATAIERMDCEELEAMGNAMIAASWDIQSKRRSKMQVLFDGIRRQRNG